MHKLDGDKVELDLGYAIEAADYGAALAFQNICRIVDGFQQRLHKSASDKVYTAQQLIEASKKFAELAELYQALFEAQERENFVLKRGQ